MRKKLTILVVDEDPQVALSIAAMLPHDVVLNAWSGPRAIDACRVVSFDAILCAVRMVHMSGPRVHDALRDLGGGMQERMVFMTEWAKVVPLEETRGRPTVMKPIADTALARVLEPLRVPSTAR